MPPSAAVSQYPCPSGLAAMPTTGELRLPLLMEPLNEVPPYEPTPPAVLASRYPNEVVIGGKERRSLESGSGRPSAGEGDTNDLALGVRFRILSAPAGTDANTTIATATMLILAAWARPFRPGRSGSRRESTQLGTLLDVRVYASRP